MIITRFTVTTVDKVRIKEPKSIILEFHTAPQKAQVECLRFYGESVFYLSPENRDILLRAK